MKTHHSRRKNDDADLADDAGAELGIHNNNNNPTPRSSSADVTSSSTSNSSNTNSPADDVEGDEETAYNLNIITKLADECKQNPDSTREYKQ